MDYQVYLLAGKSPSPSDTALLDSAEQQAYARRGERYLLIRSILKREIARRLSCPPATIYLPTTPNGKPTHPLCHFNISHSGDYLCIAFHHHDIGVDIEHIRTRHFQRLAPRFMAPEQLQAFLHRDCPQQEFYACWCAAEALVKHQGATIWQAHDFPFIYEQGRIHPLYSSAPTVELFTPAPEYCGAIAYSE